MITSPLMQLMSLSQAYDKDPGVPVVCILRDKKSGIDSKVISLGIKEL